MAKSRNNVVSISSAKHMPTEVRDLLGRMGGAGRDGNRSPDAELVRTLLELTIEVRSAKASQQSLLKRKQS